MKLKLKRSKELPYAHIETPFGEGLYEVWFAGWLLWGTTNRAKAEALVEQVNTGRDDVAAA